MIKNSYTTLIGWYVTALYSLSLFAYLNNFALMCLQNCLQTSDCLSL